MMTHDELDALLDGSESVTMVIVHEETGEQATLYLDRQALRDPVAWRAAIREQLHYEPPVYSQRDHHQIVRAMFRLTDAEEASRAERYRSVAV